MTYKENITAILECYFTGFKKEIIDSACNRILEIDLITSTNSLTHKIAEFFSNWDGDETAKMEISVKDMREIADVYRRKARIERQLKEIRQELCGNEVSL